MSNGVMLQSLHAAQSHPNVLSDLCRKHKACLGAPYLHVDQAQYLYPDVGVHLKHLIELTHLE